MGRDLKKSELARCLGAVNATVTMAVNRKKLIPEPDGKINIEHPVNKNWIDKYLLEKGRTFDLNRIYDKGEIKPPSEPTKKKPKKKKPKKEKVKKESSSVTDASANGSTDDDVLTLAAREQELKVDKLEAEVKLKNLEVEKKEGLLIPTDAVKSVMIFIIETFRSTFIQDMNNIANIYTQMLGANQQQFVEVRKRIAECVKDITEQAKENAITGVEGIVEEYSETRGRGERK
jgi:hypothetical protein